MCFWGHFYLNLMSCWCKWLFCLYPEQSVMLVEQNECRLLFTCWFLRLITHLFVFFGLVWFWFCAIGVWTQSFLGRCHLSHSSSPFSLVISEMGSHFLPRPIWTASLFYTSCCWLECRRVPPPPVMVEMGSHELFVQAGLELWFILS
jgi:hypothetical protein